MFIFWITRGRSGVGRCNNTRILARSLAPNPLKGFLYFQLEARSLESNSGQKRLHGADYTDRMNFGFRVRFLKMDFLLMGVGRVVGWVIPHSRYRNVHGLSITLTLIPMFRLNAYRLFHRYRY